MKKTIIKLLDFIEKPLNKNKDSDKFTLEYFSRLDVIKDYVYNGSSHNFVDVADLLRNVEERNYYRSVINKIKGWLK